MSIRVPSKKVLVTGANGFIGLHTVLRLLQLGHRVHATVRTEVQQKNVQDALSRLVDTGNLAFYLADLIQDDGWQAAIQGCDYVIHTASPTPLVDPKDEDELITPARDGTLRILCFALAEQIKRVVFLSTIGAVVPGHLPRPIGPTWTSAGAFTIRARHWLNGQPGTLSTALKILQEWKWSPLIHPMYWGPYWMGVRMPPSNYTAY